MSDIEVHICYAIVKLEGKLVPLSLKVAKQFPIRHRQVRWDDAVKGRNHLPAICKVNARTLDKDTSDDWFYLIDDPGWGLCWAAPAVPAEDFKKTLIERGGWYDKPETVPTIIFF